MHFAREDTTKQCVATPLCTTSVLAYQKLRMKSFYRTVVERNRTDHSTSDSESRRVIAWPPRTIKLLFTWVFARVNLFVSQRLAKYFALYKYSELSSSFVLTQSLQIDCSFLVILTPGLEWVHVVQCTNARDQNASLLALWLIRSTTLICVNDAFSFRYVCQPANKSRKL